MNKKRIYYFPGIILALLVMLCVSKSDVYAETISSDSATVQATKAEISIKTSTGKATGGLQDGSYSTTI